jgi:hypothetical protein
MDERKRIKKQRVILLRLINTNTRELKKHPGIAKKSKKKKS